MQYILSEKEFQDLKWKASRVDSLIRVAEDKDDKLTKVGLILHEILGTEFPPETCERNRLHHIS